MTPSSFPLMAPTRNTFAILPDIHPAFPSRDSDGGDPEVPPCDQVWDDFEDEYTVNADDYFDEIQQMIANGESIFHTMLPPLEDELGLGPEDFDDIDLIPPNLEDDSFGIDVEGSHFFSDHPLCRSQSSDWR